MDRKIGLLETGWTPSRRRTLAGRHVNRRGGTEENKNGKTSNEKKSNRGVVRPRGEGIPVGVEANGVDVRFVALEALHALASPNVPDEGVAVGALNKC